MKKSFLFAGLLLASALVYTGCSKDEDIEAPVITLDGDNPLVLSEIGLNYVEPGFTATDNEDGDVSNQVTVDNSDLNEDLTGTYEINYSVTDEAGNTGTATREVTVLNAADFLKGSYSVQITCPGLSPYNYAESINMSETVNNKIIFSKFGNYAGAENKVYANVTQISGIFTNITIPTQTVNCGDPLADREFSGTGTISVSGNTITIVINVSETTNGSTVQCNYIYTR